VLKIWSTFGEFWDNLDGQGRCKLEH